MLFPATFVFFVERKPKKPMVRRISAVSGSSSGSPAAADTPPLISLAGLPLEVGLGMGRSSTSFFEDGGTGFEEAGPVGALRGNGERVRVGGVS